MVAGAAHFVMLFLANEGGMPLQLIVIMVVIFILVAVGAQSDRMERKKAWKDKKKVLEAKKLLEQREREEKLGEVEITIECPGIDRRF